MIIINLSIIATLVGFVLGLLEKDLMPKKPSKFRSYAEDGILGDITHKIKIGQYKNQLNRVQGEVLKRVKIIIAYLIAFPLVSMAIELGLNYFWWYESDVEEFQFALFFVFIPSSFYYIDCLIILISYVKESKIKKK